MQLFLQTITTNLAKSKAYFTALDFEVKDGGDYTLVYDQQLKILIDHSNTARSGLTIIKENWEKELGAISKLTKVIKRDDAHYFTSPSGTWFKLISGATLKVPKTDAKCVLGKYTGISLETMDIQKSIDIISCLGFEKNNGSVDQGWVSCEDGSQNSISLMAPFSCPHSFCNPSATFFNSGKNPEVIAKIRSKQIEIYEEITAFNPQGEVDNVILREPGGVGFFVFND